MFYRNPLFCSCAIGAALGFAAFAPSAVAQDITYTWTCQDVGANPPEALGDREGHSISVDAVSCHSKSESMSGALLTGTYIWEWNGPNAVLLSATGVIRKPGATMVYQETGGSIALTMTDGKVTGFTASGKGYEKLATGSLAALAGTPYTWTVKPAGPGQSTVVVKNSVTAVSK
jgi:hypothetical protein